MVQKACDDVPRVCGRRGHVDHSRQHPQWPRAPASEMDCCTVESVWPLALAPQTCLDCGRFPEGGNCLACYRKWQFTALTNFCSWHASDTGVAISPCMIRAARSGEPLRAPTSCEKHG